MRYLVCLLIALSFVFSSPAISGQKRNNSKNRNNNNNKNMKNRNNSSKMHSGIKKNNNNDSNKNSQKKNMSGSRMNFDKGNNRSDSQYNNYRRNRKTDVQALYNEVEMPDPWTMRQKLASTGTTAKALPKSGSGGSSKLELTGKIGRKVLNNSSGETKTIYAIACADGTLVKLPPAISFGDLEDAPAAIDYDQYVGKLVSLKGYGSRTLGSGGKLEVSLTQVLDIAATSTTFE